jgi:HEAT repeat protein
MRRFLFVMVLISLSGCGRAQPRMAGSKWAEALRDPDVKVRKKAAFTLGNIGPSDPAVLPALLGALQDADAGVRCETILALVKFGKEGREALPALDRARQCDASTRVRTYAARAAQRLRAEEAPAGP